MKNCFITIKQAMSKVFNDKKYYAIFILSFIILGILYFIIPVLLLPKNSLIFQLNSFAFRDYFFLVLLSGLNAIFVTLQIFLIKENNLKNAGSTKFKFGLSSFFAGFVGMAGCPVCAVPLFAFFGITLGGTPFLIKYQLYFILALIVLISLMITSIYLLSKKITKTCDSCRI